MGRLSDDTGNIAAATRGLIIQRVIVDGWDPARAAAAFGVGERQIVRWVAAYRSHGMASLRDEAAGDVAPRRWLRRLRATIRGIFMPGPNGTAQVEAAPLVLPPRHGDDTGDRRRHS